MKLKDKNKTNPPPRLQKYHTTRTVMDLINMHKMYMILNFSMSTWMDKVPEKLLQVCETPQVPVCSSSKVLQWFQQLFSPYKQ
jgi:hypothetical protein